jgi:hypothetical protein
MREGVGLSFLMWNGRQVPYKRNRSSLIRKFGTYRSSIVRIHHGSIVFFVPSAKLSFCRTELYVRSYNQGVGIIMDGWPYTASELHLAVSGQQEPELLSLHYRGGCCPWMCLENKSLSSSYRLVHTPQGSELHLNVSAWRAGVCPAPGCVYTTESSPAPGRVFSTGPVLHLGAVYIFHF